MALPAPLNVAPLIKFARWSALFAGIFYGATRYSALSRKENALREEWERTRPEREAKRAAELSRKTEAEMRQLAKEVGVEIPPGTKF